MKTYTQEQLASRIANLRSVENVMSKYAFLANYKRSDEAVRKYWCAPEAEPTLTTNDHKYNGYTSVFNHLSEQGEAITRRDNDIMRQKFPDTFADQADSEM